MRVGFIGLGVMGYPMAGHLACVGHDVAVCNRTPAKAAKWLAEHRGRAAPSPRAAAEGAELVFACVTADADLRAVALGDDGALAGMAAGAVFVDHGSGSPGAARAMAEEARARGVGFLDAPVTGGSAGARNGTLSILAGGEAADLERARPAMEAYAGAINGMGPSGAGHLTKLVNVVIGQGNAMALAEGLGFAIRAGLDPSRVVEALSPGSAHSWVMDQRSGPMIARDYRTRYSVDLARKDLGNALAEAAATGAELPLAAMTDRLFARLQSEGFGARDAASIIELFAPNDDKEPGP